MVPTTLTTDVQHASDLFVAIIDKLMTQRMLDQSFEQQVTPAQLLALRYLTLNESSLMSDVAAGLGISFPAATKTIDRLVRKELASRVEDPHDRRVVRIRLTDRGKMLVADIYEERAHRFSNVLERLSPSARDGLQNTMEAFITAAIDDKDTVDKVCLHCGSLHHESCPVKQAYLRLTRADASAVQ